MQSIYVSFKLAVNIKHPVFCVTRFQAQQKPNRINKVTEEEKNIGTKDQFWLKNNNNNNTGKKTFIVVTLEDESDCVACHLYRWRSPPS